MIQQIPFSLVLPIWQTRLWTNRGSDITPTSAMVFMGGHDGNNMHGQSTFWGYVVNGTLVGVNSGHTCADGSYRSRGLWVEPNYRFQGIGKKLLQATIECGRKHNCVFCWSLPRQQSWPAYQSVGYELCSDWFPTETNSLNAFCRLGY